MIYKATYIAGPMTGYDRFNFPEFDYVRDIQKAYSEVVFSPADHDRMLLDKPDDWMPSESDSKGPWKEWSIPDAPSLRDMLGADLAWIAKEADSMVMLPDWEKSSGANAEWALAKALSLKIIYR